MTAITVAAMIEALSALPPDAELVVTESGYYCYGEFATIMLPEAYTVEGVENDADAGRVVYRIVTATNRIKVQEIHDTCTL